jgi:hypothetical protein
MGVPFGCEMLLKRCGTIDTEAEGIAVVVEDALRTQVTFSQSIALIIV